MRTILAVSTAHHPARYSGSPSQIIDALPALLNSVTMIHTIARYYNTSDP